MKTVKSLMPSALAVAVAALAANGMAQQSRESAPAPQRTADTTLAEWLVDKDARVSELVGKLQSRLLLRSISFSVSPETRAKTEEALIGEVLAAFQERAKKVQEGLGARDWELVSLSIQTPGAPGPVPMYARAEMAMDKAVAAPSFESGQSTLTIRADGMIELER